MNKSEVYLNYHFPRWEELPDIELYMDQVVNILEKNLSIFSGDEKLITSSMINNYVKQKNVKPPVKKRYDKGYIAYLFVVCILKRIMPIAQICKGIEFMMLSYSVPIFCTELENSLKELFAGKKVTMVKIWNTTCGHCIHELPNLTKLNDEFEPLGGQVIGIVYNAVDADEIKEAEEIIQTLGVDFPNLLPNETIRKLFRTQVFPATFFINEKGILLADPVLGSRFSEYEELLNQYLSQE